jgi:hypothetical protein
MLYRPSMVLVQEASFVFTESRETEFEFDQVVTTVHLVCVVSERTVLDLRYWTYVYWVLK